jgi:hypothetical protein
MLGVALCLSAIAAFYSIIGLTAIFAAAVIPVAIMGTILEIAKLTVTVWLHEYWAQVKRGMKAYLVPAVAMLMLITSMGIFGFLSKAHLDQAVPAGDISAQVTIFDEKIKTQRDNIEAARAALRQLDAAVDQTMGRSADERGAERAVQIRRSQQAERTRLQTDIGRAQTEIARLQEQRAPVAAQARKVEAEVGPIKYIAALIYGDNPDQNLLEKAVRWVIILLVLVFDPLAIFMLLAATESYKWERARQAGEVTVLTREQPKTAGERLMEWRDKIQQWRKPNDTLVDDDGTVTKNLVEQPPGPDVDVKPPAPVVGQPPAETVEITSAPPIASAEVEDDELESDPVIKRAKSLWKERNPGGTLKEERRRLQSGEIDHLPWMDLVTEAGLPMSTYGPKWPIAPVKGDHHIRTDRQPTEVYKHNGVEWILIDKNTSDVYAYNDNYIDFLINKISSGEYDPELLNDAEREQIEQRLKRGIE